VLEAQLPPPGAQAEPFSFDHLVPGLSRLPEEWKADATFAQLQAEAQEAATAAEKAVNKFKEHVREHETKEAESKGAPPPLDLGHQPPPTPASPQEDFDMLVPEEEVQDFINK